MITEPNPLLIALSCLALLVAITTLLRPKLTLLLYFLWVPFADLGKRLLWIPPEVTPTWTEYQIALLLPDLILLAGAIRAAYDLLMTRTVRYPPIWLDLPVGLFFLWSFLNIFNPASTIYVGLVGFKSSVFYILIYILLRLYLAQSTLPQLRTGIIATAGLAAVYAVYQVVWGFPEFELAWLNSGLSELGGGEQGLGGTIALFGVERPFSTFASHEQLGWYLGGALLLLTSYPRLRWLHWIVLVLAAVVLARTLSRSAWLFTFTGLGVAFILSLHLRVRAALIPLIAIPLVFGAGYVAWSSFGQQTEADSGLTDSPFAQRASATGTYEWRIFSFRALLEDPTWRRPFGNGTGSMWYAWRLDRPGTENPSSAEVYEFGPTGLPEGKRILSHVGTVDIIYELGLLGLGLFTWVIGAGMVTGLNILRRTTSKEARQWTLVAMALVLGVVAANSTATTILGFRPVASLFWLAVGVIGIFAVMQSEELTRSDDLHVRDGYPSD